MLVNKHDTGVLSHQSQPWPAPGWSTISSYKKLGLLWLIIFCIHLGASESSLARTPSEADHYEIYLTKAITDTKILPDTFPVPGVRSTTLTVTACRGEYEAASFVVRALREVKDLVITATALQGAGASIPATAVDIRAVKCWWQAGDTPKNEGKPALVPELLLKDDKLIRVDLKQKANYLRTNYVLEKDKYVLISGPNSDNLWNIKPMDADMLQPIDIDAETNKQFWVTFHVPEDVIPGVYEGKIELSASNAPSAKITLKVHVLPFTLARPALRYSIFYRGKLAPRSLEEMAQGDHLKRGIINSEWKTSQQYLAEMRDLKAHGIEYPGLSQADEQLVRKELNIRASVGFPKGILYFNGVGVPLPPYTPSKLEGLRHEMLKWLRITKDYGYVEVYFYGLDEARGEMLTSQRPAWNAVHEAGGKVFAACYKGAFEVMGDLLDLALLSAKFDVQEVEKYHKINHKIFTYGNPAGDCETPETYRRNYGLGLWKAGYDGSMIYAYQDTVGRHIWNDFDAPWRDTVFAYPTINGVIDTRQWEGFREGIDDVRYLTTLLKTIDRAELTKPKLSGDAKAWIKQLDPQSDLDTLRTEIIEWIMKLR